MTTIGDNLIEAVRTFRKDLLTKDEIIALIRRTTSTNKLPTLESNGIVIDPEKYHVINNGVKCVIPRKEFELLYYLIQRKNRFCTRYELFRDVWGTEVIVTDGAINVLVRKLRAKFGPNNIKTRRGVGIMWEEK